MTARATARASASSRAPVTWHVISVVAPSPSAACWRARSRATASIARPEHRPRPRCPAPTAAVPAAPEARTKTVSFVLVSPSTVSWSQVRAAAGRSRPLRTAGVRSRHRSARPTASSPSAGWIMPTPLAMPLTRDRHGPPVRVGQLQTVAVATFVARIGGAQCDRPRPRDAAWSSVSRSATSAAAPAATLSSGRRVPMIPVERCRVRGTVVAAEPRPGAAAMRAGRRRPAAPVAAFAQPLVEMTASAQPNPPRGSSEVAARWAWESRTGAAANAFGVKTAAAAAGPDGRDDEGQVRPAGRLDPRGRRRRRGSRRGGRRAARLPGRSAIVPGGVPGRRASCRHGTSGSWSRPAVSGRPWTRLNAWTAWPAAPLTRLSSTATTRIRPVRSSSETWMRTWLEPVDVLGGRRRGHDRHERLVLRTRPRRGRRAPPWSRSWSVGRGRPTGCRASSG